MRTTIVVIVAVAIGAVLGILFGRAQTTPKLVAMADDLAKMRTNQERVEADLAFASERMNWLKAENQALNEQVVALQRSKGLAATEGEAHLLEVASGPSDGAVSTTSGTGRHSSSEGAYTDGADGTSNASGAQGEPNPLESKQRALVQLERKRIEDFLAEQMEAANDPAEQARLNDVLDHLASVHQRYRELQAAQTSEERVAILDAIAQSRANLKALVDKQRNEMMRRELANAGVTDSSIQRNVISAMDKLEESPYWTEPMMIWGMGSDPQFDAGSAMGWIDNR